MSEELLGFTLNGTRIPRAVFWLPKPRIPDTTSMNFPGFRIPQAKISGIQDFLKLGDTKTVFHSLVPRVLSYPASENLGTRLRVSLSLGLHYLLPKFELDHFDGTLLKRKADKCT